MMLYHDLGMLHLLRCNIHLPNITSTVIFYLLCIHQHTKDVICHGKQYLLFVFPVRILNKTAYLLHCLIKKMTPRIARQTIAVMMNRYLFVLDTLLCLTSISLNVPKGIDRNDLSRRTRPETIVRKVTRVSYERYMRISCNICLQ